MTFKTELNITGALLTAAYLYLLRLPHNETRLRVQPVLCALRDEIARISGEKPENIQNQCEQLVAEQGETDLERTIKKLGDFFHSVLGRTH